MNERIKYLRKDVLKLSQKEFSVKLGLSENYVWMIEKGKREPSDRTVSDICRLFSVREDWLRTGDGEMFEPKTKEEEVAEMVGNILNGSSEFKKIVIKLICSRSDEELAALEQALRNIYESL